MAFLRCSSAAVVTRLAGAFPEPGIHVFPDGMTLATVINVTHAAEDNSVSNRSILSRPVTNGDIVELVPRDGQHLEITVNAMKARERMLLGIPLDPDQMAAADWEMLPGIGPALARAIVDDRQKNGEFGSIKALVRVPGVGEKKILAVKRFF